MLFNILIILIIIIILLFTSYFIYKVYITFNSQIYEHEKSIKDIKTVITFLDLDSISQDELNNNILTYINGINNNTSTLRFLESNINTLSNKNKDLETKILRIRENNTDLNLSINNINERLDNIAILSQTKSINQDLPKNTIIPYNGTIIPDGWVECDGTNSTPDLRGRMIIGKTDVDLPHITKKPFDDVGGSEFIKINDENYPSHDHKINVTVTSALNQINNSPGAIPSATSFNTLIGAYENTLGTFEPIKSGGVGKPFSIMNPYRSLMYIMKK